MIEYEDDGYGDWLRDSEKGDRVVLEALGPDPRDVARDEALLAEWIEDERLCAEANAAPRCSVHERPRPCATCAAYRASGMP